MSPEIEDLTRVIQSADKDWLPMPFTPGCEIKVIVADTDLNKVIYLFRFGPGVVLPRHRHKCHAVAYTLSGEWEYEGLKLPAGAVAYEPVESEHTPSSEHGAELLVFLSGETDELLINYMEDGTELPATTSSFKLLEGASIADVERINAQLEEMLS
jgi:anti-sigma factor ChrR (cupin superfamily)